MKRLNLRVSDDIYFALNEYALAKTKEYGRKISVNEVTEKIFVKFFNLTIEGENKNADTEGDTC